MGTRTLQQLREDAWLFLDQRPDLDPATAGGLARLNLWVNRAYRHVSWPNVHPHRELKITGNIALVLGSDNYALTALTSFWAVRHIHHARANRRLQPRALWALLEQRQLDSAGVAVQGEPSLYAIDGSNLLLDYAANSAVAGQNLVVYYWRRIANLVNNTDVTLLADEWDQIIPLGVAWYGWNNLNQLERADYFRTEFAAMASEVVPGESIEHLDEGPQIDYLADPIMERSQ